MRQYPTVTVSHPYLLTWSGELTGLTQSQSVITEPKESASDRKQLHLSLLQASLRNWGIIQDYLSNWGIMQASLNNWGIMNGERKKHFDI